MTRKLFPCAWLTLALGLLLFFGPMLQGCGLLDRVAGVSATGTDLPGPSPAEVAAPWANAVIPGSGLLLTALAGLWAAVRGRAWRRVAETTFDVIEKSKDLDIGKLKDELKAAHDTAGVIALARKIVDRYGHE
jgi:hypothetical protein